MFPTALYDTSNVYPGTDMCTYPQWSPVILMEMLQGFYGDSKSKEETTNSILDDTYYAKYCMIFSNSDHMSERATFVAFLIPNVGSSFKCTFSLTYLPQIHLPAR